MPRTSPDFNQKSFRIKHEDDKFFTRFLSKETSKAYPSFRVYYGDVSSAVPFTWETRPGTPKHPSCIHSDIPPLTPPPSYYATNFRPSSSAKQTRSKLLLHTLLRRMNSKKVPNSGPSSSLSTSSSFSSQSWTSSSRSLFSDPTTKTTTTPTCVSKRRQRLRFASWGSSFDHGMAVDQDCPSKLMCFGTGKEYGDSRVHGRNYSLLIMKRAFLSIIGCGSS